MKTLFRVLGLAIFLTAFSALTFAQEQQPDLATMFDQFKKEGPPAKTKCGGRAPALVTGKKIVDTFEPKPGETDPKVLEFYNLNKPVIDFVKKRMAEIQAEDPVCEREQAYIAAFQAKNWANVFTTGKVIINAEGDNGKGLDIMLDLVSVGFDRAFVDKNDTFNNDTLNFAKTALQRLEAGKPSNSGKYGAFVPFNTKENAQSWMNYIIGWQMYNKMSQKKEALPYLYKATTIGSEKKNDSTIYTSIGTYYFDEAVRLDAEYREKRKANNNEETDEIKALLALARGTADRAADAFGRAYKIVPAGPAKTAIAETLSNLYKFRFNLADAKQADVDKYIADLVAKPMPDPATAVTPVVETTPTTATTTSTTPTSSTTVNTTSEAAAATTKTTVKKPVTKKKGTR